MSNAKDENDIIVILGGGVIGSAIAYYLSIRGRKSIIVEQTEIAAGASGKAGGFLAKDWNKGTLASISSRSFDLHLELSKCLEVDYGFRLVDTFQVLLHKFTKG
jgi:glycine/D-amino acid oxidase-like deaminating enzyme